MNVSSFMSGKFLTQVDLPSPIMVWTITEAAQKTVGTDEKICVSFQEFAGKPLA